MFSAYVQTTLQWLRDPMHCRRNQKLKSRKDLAVKGECPAGACQAQLPQPQLCPSPLNLDSSQPQLSPPGLGITVPPAPQSGMSHTPPQRDGQARYASAKTPHRDWGRETKACQTWSTGCCGQDRVRMPGVVRRQTWWTAVLGQQTLALLERHCGL
jgi:hypothetical protein